MENVIELAESNIRNGYNCAQSVLLAFAPQFDLPGEKAAQIAGAFGAGMNRTGQTCGAVSGALMVLGLKYGATGVPEQVDKDQLLKIVQQFFKEFKERHASPICNDILGVDLNTPEGYQYAKENGLFKSVCIEVVKDAADIAQKLMDDACFP